MRAPTLLSFLFGLLAPWMALAWQASPPASQGTRGSFIWYFGLAVMAFILVAWTWRVLRKKEPPHILPR